VAAAMGNLCSFQFQRHYCKDARHNHAKKSDVGGGEIWNNTAVAAASRETKQQGANKIQTQNHVEKPQEAITRQRTTQKL
jgi:hypothetical protein